MFYLLHFFIYIIINSTLICLLGLWYMDKYIEVGANYGYTINSNYKEDSFFECDILMNS